MKNSNDPILGQFKRDLYELNDKIIELELPLNINDKPQLNTKDEYFHGKWFIVNANLNLNKKETNHINSQTLINIENEDNDDFILNYQPLKETTLNYYNMITDIILNQNDSPNNDSLFLQILKDLKNNQKLQSLLPYLINFTSQTTRILTQHCSIITSTTTTDQKVIIQYLYRCLQVLHSIIINRYNFLAPKGFVI
jgi:hypothetical protein